WPRIGRLDRVIIEAAVLTLHREKPGFRHRRRWRWADRAVHARIAGVPAADRQQHQPGDDNDHSAHNQSLVVVGADRCVGPGADTSVRPYAVKTEPSPRTAT